MPRPGSFKFDLARNHCDGVLLPCGHSLLGRSSTEITLKWSLHQKVCELAYDFKMVRSSLSCAQRRRVDIKTDTTATDNSFGSEFHFTKVQPVASDAVVAESSAAVPPVKSAAAKKKKSDAKKRSALRKKEAKHAVSTSAATSVKRSDSTSSSGSSASSKSAASQTERSQSPVGVQTRGRSKSPHARAATLLEAKAKQRMEAYHTSHHEAAARARSEKRPFVSATCAMRRGETHVQHYERFLANARSEDPPASKKRARSANKDEDDDNEEDIVYVAGSANPAKFLKGGK